MRRFSSFLFLLTLVCSSLGIFIATLGHPDQVSILSGVAIGLIFISLILERVWPYRSDWNVGQGDAAGDVSSFVLIFGLLDGLLKWGTPFLLLIVFGVRSHEFFSLPLWIEIVLVTLVIEFGAYLAHRFHHTNSRLWALHAMHHSPTRLYTLNNFRFHPLNHVINHALIVLPALLLGFSPEAILGYTAFATPVLMLQHSNVDFRFGWLDYVLNTNAVHRWHHSAHGGEGNCNYGRATVIWDHVFRTFYYPDSSAAPEAIGIEDAFAYPAARRFLAQLKYPFTAGCCR